MELQAHRAAMMHGGKQICSIRYCRSTSLHQLKTK